MEEHRIYGEKIEINTSFVRAFYDKRAAMIDEKGWGAVSLGDEDSSIAAKVYDHDKETLFPKLGITPTARVLELGCGMGRWAKIVLPHCDTYCGVDFSKEMLDAAKKICRGDLDRSSFYHMTASEAVEKDAQFFGGAFHCIIISGICMYINDLELKHIFELIPFLCQTHCAICIKEPAAFEKRLTLNEFPSEALHSNYNAIYRTPQEYASFFQPLLETGFSVCEQGFLPIEVGRKRPETNGWCTILKR